MNPIQDILNDYQFIFYIVGAFIQIFVLLLMIVLSLFNSSNRNKLEKNMEKKFTWLKIYLVSMDRAMEHSFQNGYAKKREEVKNSLIIDEDFLRDNDEDSRKIEVTLFKGK